MSITKLEMRYINSHASESYKITGNSQKTLSSYGNVTLYGEQTLTNSRDCTVGNDVYASRTPKSSIRGYDEQID